MTENKITVKGGASECTLAGSAPAFADGSVGYTECPVHGRHNFGPGEPSPTAPSSSWFTPGKADEVDPDLLARAMARGQQLVAAGYGKASTLPDGRVPCGTCYPCRDLARPADCRHPVSRAEATYRTAWAADPQRLIDQARDADRVGVTGYAPVVSVAEHRERGALVARLRQLG